MYFAFRVRTIGCFLAFEDIKEGRFLFVGVDCSDFPRISMLLSLFNLLLRHIIFLALPVDVSPNDRLNLLLLAILEAYRILEHCVREVFVFSELHLDVDHARFNERLFYIDRLHVS